MQSNQKSHVLIKDASGGGTIQMLVRLGKPTKEVPLTMRRDVMDLIEAN
jgi:hypothetical protein